ncbi:hypothetical protein HYFRA_00014134 [Hymenoscyphus fraxineus]|uniref:Uncharacterized protein n=1 Tax=Hymenoscyphus fraxineus TaxID=746836 RepID=A0A9N9LD53_9HELO|nr:hypothetical protein HYFRA_00014134 [Hymenoscyphus fraxineus]
MTLFGKVILPLDFTHAFYLITRDNFATKEAFSSRYYINTFIGNYGAVVRLSKGLERFFNLQSSSKRKDATGASNFDPYKDLSRCHPSEVLE